MISRDGHMFTLVYLCLHVYPCSQVLTRVPLFTCVYQCLLVYDYPCLPMFMSFFMLTLFYHLFTRVYLYLLHLPKLNCVQPCFTV